MLLEAGVPLNYPLVLAGETRAPDKPEFTLLDVVCDAVANYSLDAPETEWSSVAICLSVPPSRRWQNRYGETFSFDDLAEHLTNRSLRGRSCGGAHVFYALVTLMAVDGEHRVLSTPARKKLELRVADLVRTALKTQRKDGSWGASWYDAGGSRGRDLLSVRLLITGHLCECFLRLTTRVPALDRAMEKAGKWLWSKLSVVLAAKRPEQLAPRFCPLVHAVCVVQALKVDH